MEQYKAINTARDLVRELAKYRNAYNGNSSPEWIEINLDRTALSKDEVANLNRRMPSLIRILNNNATNVRLQCGFAKLANLYLHGASLRGVDLAGTDLSGASISGADLKNSNLRAADLRGADLRDTNFDGAYIRKTRFHGSYRQGAQLENSVPGLFDHDRMAEFTYGEKE